MKTVLIVDDETSVLKILQRICSLLGYKTTITDSVDFALKKFSEETFDLVLMDVVMPDNDGLLVAREMKRIKPNQIIILVTGIGRNEAILQSYFKNVFVEDILLKPFSFWDVKVVLADNLSNN